jgi:hypothetical protein
VQCRAGRGKENQWPGQVWDPVRSLFNLLSQEGRLLRVIHYCKCIAQQASGGSNPGLGAGGLEPFGDF